MKHSRRLTVVIEREDDGFVALCPEREPEIAQRLQTEVFVTQVEVPVG